MKADPYVDVFYSDFQFEPAPERQKEVASMIEDFRRRGLLPSEEESGASVSWVAHALTVAINDLRHLREVTGRGGRETRATAKVTGSNESIATAYAYPPLMILTQSHAQMAKNLEPLGGELDSLLRSLVAPLLSFWRAAATKPTLFAPLSFPEPSAPNSTLVHNWTFASIGFARMLGVEVELAAARPSPGHHRLQPRLLRMSSSD